MDTSETVDVPVALPGWLYQALEQRAQLYGHSVNHEIVTLLSSSMPQLVRELRQEFSEWEAASDEDWLSIKTALTAAKAF